MSSSKATDVNAELPDQEALASFANSALGNRRRRRGQSNDAAADTTASPTPPAETQPEETASAPVPPVVEVPPGPGPARRVEPTQTEEAVVPAPAPVPVVETPKTAAPPQKIERAQEQPEQAQQAQQEEQEGSGGQEVAVRAVAGPPATHRPVPLAYRSDVQIDQVQVPSLGPAGARATQCTVMVSHSVRERFAHYQLSKKMAGDKEPSNALVVRRAFLYCKRNNLFGKVLADVYQQHNAVDEEDYDEDGMLGEVVGRRAVRGRLKDSGQQSFRPSEQELANYDAFCQAYGFPSRSDFLNAVLDEFLPQLPTAGRRR
ncbi:hypothetical protein [Streptomyces europaeiscabiei]|uniref:hypothetical protein n=1 Tax=Streptomyces europaeiscabiei TaxID=146819 RepID=UPI002E26BA06|nr:hypothetical protein OG858_47635 [Streptomyces europaeiscabiei]